MVRSFSPHWARPGLAGLRGEIRAFIVDRVPDLCVHNALLAHRPQQKAAPEEQQQAGQRQHGGVQAPHQSDRDGDAPGEGNDAGDQQ